MKTHKNRVTTNYAYLVSLSLFHIKYACFGDQTMEKDRVQFHSGEPKGTINQLILFLITTLKRLLTA